MYIYFGMTILNKRSIHDLKNPIKVQKFYFEIV
jgi:hypothetical protein